ncbi:hypothetical protein HG535_0E05510 [Zygotorulaspora mrakii]|uniref:Increased recombination centers protein 19 n=1 Tax=Zygotorulaspora mrakii TaxID=42260 RepID=A0A7H9B4J1_ZYGMR|nr:uncharacterized protein HG535_0E05510 [Zygotorulaspora mrakii]QLG73467.1 hypothetical protein HG535_0E05510 [Zygotorulaspora mrakii]
MSWQTISTNNAVVTGTYALIKRHSKVFLPQELVDDVSVDEAKIVQMTYRRFMRLRPFISRRKMVRDTYTAYLRYKFKKENYALKRSMVVMEPQRCCIRKELWNSLMFFTKSVIYLPESKTCKYEISRDNTACRQILKNMLTMEFQKESIIYGSRLRDNKLYLNLRESFQYVKCEQHSNPNLMIIGEFDRYIIYLNELLHTRL